MLKNFKLPEISVKDPRIAMRAVIGVLLAANLAAAIMAFHPFGGGADDLRQQQAALNTQLEQLQGRLVAGKDLVKKVQLARTEGDEFMSQYFMTSQTEAALILAEMVKSEQDAGIHMRQDNFSQQEIEGSTTLHMLSTQVGLEGNYASLAKFVNLLDKSSRFLIIESMTASAPQQHEQGAKGPVDQNLTVVLKIDAFVKDVLPGAGL
jgi:type IV pilus assembly protein PilO